MVVHLRPGIQLFGEFCRLAEKFSVGPFALDRALEDVERLLRIFEV
jgi:hypothetical protein